MINKAPFNQRLYLIGFQIGYSDSNAPVSKLSLFDYDIEETLIEACYESQTDLRLLSILATWITIHGDFVIVEKFFKKARDFEKYRGRNPVLNLVAAQGIIAGFHKWKKWITCSPKSPEYPVKPSLLKGSIDFHGPNQELAKYGVLVPKSFLRIRETDVLTHEELAKANLQYRNRLIYGCSWRSEIISAIECGVVNPAAISRLVGCSYEPAYRISKEYLLAKRVSPAA